ncbi:MAG: trypsin-like peptidase domain-containing protein [Pyrobaculum sp.]
MDFSSLVEKVAPSVVGVVVARELDIYGQGVGSAFAIADGVYATAYHVVEAAGEVALITPEGEVAPAEVVAGDPEEDLALLYSHLKKRPLPLGTATKLKVGEPVVALGYPLAMLDSPTATFGIVSAVGRSLSFGNRRFEFLIQTDAAINPGNSGGPLVNTKGEAVGVNSAVIAGAQGIGFAVPIDMVTVMYRIWTRYGRYIRPALGLYVAAINKAMAALYRLPVERGLLVVDVYPDSPADRLGFRRGDIIVKTNGVSVSNVFELRLQIADSIIKGKTPVFEIFREGVLTSLP